MLMAAHVSRQARTDNAGAGRLSRSAPDVIARLAAKFGATVSVAELPEQSVAELEAPACARHDENPLQVHGCTEQATLRWNRIREAPSRLRDRPRYPDETQVQVQRTTIPEPAATRWRTREHGPGAASVATCHDHGSTEARALTSHRRRVRPHAAVVLQHLRLGPDPRDPDLCASGRDPFVEPGLIREQ